jgi:tetratricopeptide (TPR) repeat protein
MRSPLATLLLIVAAGSVVHAEDRSGRAAELLAEGNAAYERKDYRAAADAYQRILDYGFEHEVIYYNLGNARFREGRLGEAVLRYEQALKLDPGDRDAADNLRHVSSLCVDQVEGPDVSFPAVAARWLLTRTTVREDAWLLCAAVWLLAAVIVTLLVGSARIPRRPLLYLATIFAGMVLVSASSLLIKEGVAGGDPLAVVLAETADVVSAPAADGTALFTVHEGLRVRIRARREGWAQIVLESGLNGWIPASDLGVV